MTSTTGIQGAVTAVDISTYTPNHVQQQEHRELIKAVEAVNASKASDSGTDEARFKLRIDNHIQVVDVVAKDGKTVLYQIPAKGFLDYAKSMETSGSNDAAAVYIPSGQVSNQKPGEPAS